MSQVYQKPYECYNCHKQIRISKIDNPAPNSKKRWEQWELDGVTEHVCNGNKEKQQQQQQLQQPTTTPNLTEELNQLREENKRLRTIVDLTRQDVRSLTAQVQLLRQELGQIFEGVKKND